MECNRIYSPKCTIWGYDCLSEVAKEIRALKGTKALIVLDSFLAKMGYVNKVKKVLDDINIKYETFLGIKSNPTVTNVNEGSKILKENQCDFCISIGGGSAHD